MKKEKIVESLNVFIDKIDHLKNEHGTKSTEFLQWIKEVKRFIEQEYGADCKHLREFKKIDYYPKNFDVFSSESSFKLAYEEGLDKAKEVLVSLANQEKGISDAVEDKSEKTKGKNTEMKIEKSEPEEEIKEENEGFLGGDSLDLEANISNKSIEVEETDEANEEIEIEIEPGDPLEEIQHEEISFKEEEVQEESAPVSEAIPLKNTKGKDMSKNILLVNIRDKALNENLFNLIKKMKFEPVVVAPEADGNTFLTDDIEKALNKDTAYAIAYWTGDHECDGKCIPKPPVFFNTGYLTSKLSCNNVLILHSSDVDVNAKAYKSLHFLEIDKILELMELKIVQEMDDAGLDIDFNFLKKKNHEAANSVQNA